MAADLKPIALIAAATIALTAGAASAAEAQGGDTWQDRAEPAVRQHVLANAQQLASTIQQAAHAAGVRPELTNLDVSRVEDRLLVRVAVAWSDPSAPRKYAAWVYWEFGEKEHVRARIVSRTAPARINPKSADRLEAYFRSEIHPAVIRAANNAAPR